ncbi:T-lymphoma invasion and metastasis-inducing protein 2-like [Leptonychotes weddellii]|uniref:T-lymphoma invasion and metastasis-inducing protein 2-like n=1 Tax=Leptonychotes weddellii TaxID=9713 RepID=A0A7F8RPQ3_LEPWE|nr:T-lymphoma invasion and metastasis-inducing protein 2-like [Leptonychotes weddellii]
MIKPEHRVEDILTLACKMRQLEPSHYGLQLRKLVDENIEYCVPAPYEYMQEQVYDEIEIFPLSVYDVQLTKTGSVSDFDFSNVPDVTTGLKRSQTDGALAQVPHGERTGQTFGINYLWNVVTLSWSKT